MESPPTPRPAFAHASEAEMARILDFYQVRWEYEPHLFPIMWNLEGAVVESFAPDFWLPELDLYLEMTTLKQRLVRKKNRKLRRLRELYPAIRIKLFYARDFRALMLKYGRLALVDDMSGTSGQVVPATAVAAASIRDAQLPHEPRLARTAAVAGDGGASVGRRSSRRERRMARHALHGPGQGAVGTSSPLPGGTAR
jgi:hypothetical protein